MVATVETITPTTVSTPGPPLPPALGAGRFTAPVVAAGFAFGAEVRAAGGACVAAAGAACVAAAEEAGAAGTPGGRLASFAGASSFFSFNPDFVPGADGVSGGGLPPAGAAAPSGAGTAVVCPEAPAGFSFTVAPAAAAPTAGFAPGVLGRIFSVLESAAGAAAWAGVGAAGGGAAATVASATEGAAGAAGAAAVASGADAPAPGLRIFSLMVEEAGLAAAAGAGAGAAGAAAAGAAGAAPGMAAGAAPGADPAGALAPGIRSLICAVAVDMGAAGLFSWCTILKGTAPCPAGAGPVGVGETDAVPLWFSESLRNLPVAVSRRLMGSTTACVAPGSFACGEATWGPAPVAVPSLSTLKRLVSVFFSRNFPGFSLMASLQKIYDEIK